MAELGPEDGRRSASRPSGNLRIVIERVIVYRKSFHEDGGRTALDQDSLAVIVAELHNP
jgi:hypothetical protein